jgi:NAD(P)-dependent dehydrogenase (short-subunit alcohol dehydrogenase family)
MNNSDLINKNILITGATSGIGKQIAIASIAYGANVIFCGRSEERLVQLNNLFGDKHQYIKVDLALDEEINALSDIDIKLDGLVHCAGIMKTLAAKFVNREALHEIMNTNFYAPTLLTSNLLKKKKINKGASIVFISSIGGNFIASKGNAMYSASKGAVNGYAKVLALELSGQSIRVNTINPGMIKTEMWSPETSSISQEQILEDEKRYPLGYGEPTDVAEATVFLLSNKSKWITGSNIVLDGGFTIQ